MRAGRARLFVAARPWQRVRPPEPAASGSMAQSTQARA